MTQTVWQDFNDAPDDIEPMRDESVGVREALLTQLLAVLQHCFPAGRQRHHQFVVGDVEGNPGYSLVVELEGERAGVWYDFATAEGGDIVALWARVHGLDERRDFAAVVDSIRQWLGQPRSEITTTPSVQPDRLGAPTQRWDYHTGEGQLVACVYRYDTPLGKEYRPWDVLTRKMRAPTPRPLYRQPDLVQATEVILVEGEKCVDALCSQGKVATTAMFGANAPIDKTDWSPLHGKRVIVWPDNDDAGRQYAERVMAYLTDHGIATVAAVQPPSHKPPKWDAADAVAEGEEIAPIIDAAQPFRDRMVSPTLPLASWRARDRFQGTPPARQWLVDGVFPLAQASLLAAAGGVGKSFLLLSLARELAQFDGQALQAPVLFGGRLAAYGAAVYITAEDDAIELHNRLAALGDIPSKLYVVPLPDAGGAQPLFSVDATTKTPTVTVQWRGLAEQLQQTPDLCVVILDPLQPLCALDLNMPENVQFVCSQLARLAASTQASVIVSHHFAKKEVQSPEQAREAIRGSGGLVDGVRSAYALWHPKQDHALSVCQRLGVEPIRGTVVLGGVVKANGRANLQVTTFVRDHQRGLLVDRTEALHRETTREASVLPDLMQAIARAAVAGKPYTKTGANGVYDRRFELPKVFHAMGKHKLVACVDQLLANGNVVASMTSGSRIVKWLDVPDGPVARGDAQFVVGHLERVSAGRKYRE